MRPDGSLAGSNNDWYGFIHNILELAPDWRADAGPAVVIGAGPNGLVAANMLADKGWDVVVCEEQPEPGGAVRSGEVTEPG
ncbi:MAG: NAD(P)-binding protein, partial [Rhodospirillales bacterium]|nr:NAD(P)-binding protein [Rhodospirillales bacterium]